MNYQNFSTKETDPLLVKYNQMLNNMKVDLVFNGSRGLIIRRKDVPYVLDIGIFGSKERRIPVFFFRVRDYNEGWKIDKTFRARHYKGEPQQSYVLINAKYTGNDPELKQYPYEGCAEPGSYKPVVFPQEIIIARNYEGPIAELAKNRIDALESEFRREYLYMDIDFQTRELNQELFDRTLINRSRLTPPFEKNT